MSFILKRSLLILIGLIQALNCQQQCTNLGSIQVFYDPTCANGGAGCNAGGQGQLCRFCGLDRIKKEKISKLIF